MFIKNKIEIKATTVEYNDEKQEKLDKLQKHIRKHSKPDEGGIKKSTHKLKEVLQEFEEFQQGIFTSRLEPKEIDKENPLPFMKEEWMGKKVEFDTEWDDELYDMLYEEIKSFEAAGTNNIPGEMFTKSPKELKEIWRLILKNCWNENWVPEEWRMTNIILLSKNELTEFMSYYRPIALAQVEMKLYTNIIYEKLAKYCADNDILEDLQFGSRKGRSAAQALVTFRQVIDDAIENNKELYVMYLDFAKAYDSVEHEMLERTLMYYKVPKTMIDMIMNLYKDNKANIYTPHGITENSIRIENGVKQGDTLSPLLFILFINPLLTKLRKSKLGYKFGEKERITVPNVTYSDDNTLMTSSEEEMNSMTEIVIDFCKQTGIRLNPTKCVYTFKNESGKCSPIEIQNYEVNPVDGEQAQRLLGIEFALNQKFETQQKKSLAQLRGDVWRTEDRNLFTRQRIKIINLMYIPKISYRMNIIEYEDNNIDKMNRICTDNIKDSMKWPRNSNNNKIWNSTEEGGPGLYNIKMVNQKTMAGTFVKQCINHSAKFPKKLIKEKLEDKGVTVENINAIGDGKGMSYLESIARIMEELNLTVKNKGKNTLHTTKIEINKGKNVKMYDKEKKRMISANFTDGSYMPDTKKTGVAIVYGPGNTKEWPALYKSKSFSSELEGLEKALATTRADIIFCDCLGAINTVKAWRKKLTKVQGVNENRSILRSIESIVRSREELGLNIPEIIWTPSHMDDKTKKITKTMKEQVEYLEERFCLETIIAKNDEVDKLAKKAAERDGGERRIWNTVDQFYMTDKEQVEEKDINKIITLKYKRKYKEKVYNNSGWGGLAKVHKKMSNIIFTKNSVHYMKLQQTMWRMRNNCLPNHARQFMKYRDMPKDDSMAIMRALLNNTPECEEADECRQMGTIADIAHMWMCPDNREERNEYEVKIKEIIKTLGKTDEIIEQWTPRERDRDELDFSATEIDTERAKREKSKRDKRKGGLFECIKERIRQREWSKDSNKRARLRVENEQVEKKRREWYEAQKEKQGTKRRYNLMLDDRQDVRRPSKRRREIMAEQEKEKQEKSKRIEIRNKRKGDKRKDRNGMETWGKKRRLNEEENRKKRKRVTGDRHLKRKQPKITSFVTGNTQPTPKGKKKRTRPDDRKKITRKELLVEVLGITKVYNIEKREESEKRWGTSELKQYGEKKKNTKEKISAKGRATQGWMMKGTVAKLRRIGRKNKMKAEVVDEKIIELIEATVMLTKKLHLKSINRNRQRKRDEGLQLQFTRNNSKNFKAIMNMRTKEDSRGIG